MFILTNQSDDDLERLLVAIHAEQDKRTVARINEFPVPTWDMKLSLPHLIMDYREQCKMAGVYVTVAQARAIINHHKGKTNA